MKREVLLSAPGQKDYASLPIEAQKRLREALLSFARTGRGDFKRLRGTRGREDLYPLRVGAYRVVIFLADEEIRVTRIFHRGGWYDWL